MDKFLGWLVVVCGLVTFMMMLLNNDYSMWGLLQGLFLVVVGGYLIVRHPHKSRKSKK